MVGGERKSMSRKRKEERCNEANTTTPAAQPLGDPSTRPSAASCTGRARTVKCAIYKEARRVCYYEPAGRIAKQTY